MASFRCNFIRERMIPVLGLMVLAMLGQASRAAEEFVYRSPAGVSFHVSANGLSSIKLGEREIAAGEWSVFNAEPWFKDGGSGLVKAVKGERTQARVDEHHARVRQSGGDLVCIYDYFFDGDDVTLSTRIENNHASSAMNIVGFSGLTFFFDRPPEGLMPVQHITYFQAHGVQLCHPGYWQPIGGTYALDDSVGVGTSPLNTGLMRTLTLWDYADWNPGKREKFPQRNLRYFAVVPVPPRGAVTLDFVLRISTDRDWKHLLGKYRDHFQKTFGPVRYKLDARFVATDYLNESPQAISPSNPYGFHPGHRRIDTADGAKLFCDEIIPPLKKANGQGIIVWGQGGEDPRGGMYRPDFDILPPEVETNWNTIARQFKEARLKLGVATRPRDMAVKLDWKSDQIISINPDDAGHRQMIWRRFDRMLKHGCTLFYLDSFGDSFEDVKLMQYLREKLGPDVRTFAEHQCDAIFPYTGGYSETTFDARATVAEIHMLIDPAKLVGVKLTIADVESALAKAGVEYTPVKAGKGEPAEFVIAGTTGPGVEKISELTIQNGSAGAVTIAAIAGFRAVPRDKPEEYRLWSGERNWEIYQWLCPGAQMSARLYEIHGIVPPTNPPDGWYFPRQITPLIPTDQFRDRLPRLSGIQGKYVEKDGSWKK